MKVKTYNTETAKGHDKLLYENSENYVWAEWEIDGGLVKVQFHDGRLEVIGNGELYNNMVICPDASNIFSLKFDKTHTEAAMKKKGRR